MGIYVGGEGERGPIGSVKFPVFVVAFILLFCTFVMPVSHKGRLHAVEGYPS